MRSDEPALRRIGLSLLAGKLAWWLGPSHYHYQHQQTNGIVFGVRLQINHWSLNSFFIAVARARRFEDVPRCLYFFHLFVCIVPHRRLALTAARPKCFHTGIVLPLVLVALVWSYFSVLK